MKKYNLKVSIMGFPKLYREFEVTENCTFDDLHEAIFEAFDRYDEHLYSFFITRKDTKNTRSIYSSPEITHPMNLEDMGYGKKKLSTSRTLIGDAGLQEKDVFHYLFDFGDDWWHRVLVVKVDEVKDKKKIIKLVKSVGESPPQYPDYDDEYDEEYE
ncbi:MAG: plasmid pRiA4b ORF-3 family protein [Deltaproteobacteria bacterium]|nr:plasmid pRiA4b ORF-3 family protein [Deltaproteobacteria bacterium]